MKPSTMLRNRVFAYSLRIEYFVMAFIHDDSFFHNNIHFILPKNQALSKTKHFKCRLMVGLLSMLIIWLFFSMGCDATDYKTSIQNTYLQTYVETKSILEDDTLSQTTQIRAAENLLNQAKPYVNKQAIKYLALLNKASEQHDTQKINQLVNFYIQHIIPSEEKHIQDIQNRIKLSGSTILEAKYIPQLLKSLRLVFQAKLMEHPALRKAILSTQTAFNADTN